MIYRNAIRLTLTCWLCFYLNACGFHLRGKLDLPASLKSMYLSTQINDPFMQQLRHRINDYGIVLTNNAKSAFTQLTIINLSHHSSVSGISSSTNTRQYTLTYQLTFSFTIDNKLILSKQSIYSSRTLTVDANRILGSDDEEITLKQEMQQDILRQLMAQITAELKKH